MYERWIEMAGLISPDEIRTWFAAAISEMYQAEVPQYATLLEVVADVNAGVMRARPDLRAALDRAGDTERVGVERHGAIRLGAPGELALMRRLFAVMGMVPTGYYDLSQAGIPVHATAFRPVAQESLRRNPFRMFTSLLCLDLIEDANARAAARAILAERSICSERLRRLIDRSESAGLTATDAREFIAQACSTFAWRSEAGVSDRTYRALHAIHPIVADIVCFRGPHINHLTPRTLDIDAAQSRMQARGLTPKAVIEGPPRRACSILLRQTSFRARDEPIVFREAPTMTTAGSHCARFGEVEARGAALTPKGRALYDRLLDTVRSNVALAPDGAEAADYERSLLDVFAEFPDTYADLEAQGLVYFRYRLGDAERANVEALDGTSSLAQLRAAGCVAYDPIVYEDFLPVSAAGIFRSNLSDAGLRQYGTGANRDAFEEQLGTRVLDESLLYAQIQAESIRSTLAQVSASRGNASDT